MKIDVRAGAPVILRVDSTSTALKGGTTHTVAYTLASVVSATKDGTVRLGGQSRNTRLGTKQYVAIAISAHLIETAARILATMAEPREWDSLESLHVHLVAESPIPAPYVAKYDRRGRLVPTNKIFRETRAPLFAPMSYDRQIINVAACLGYKRGLLPLNGTSARIASNDGATAVVIFSGFPEAPVSVEVRNLDWTPAAPVESDCNNS